jgi:hypothetical protein
MPSKMPPPSIIPPQSPRREEAKVWTTKKISTPNLKKGFFLKIKFFFRKNVEKH